MGLETASTLADLNANWPLGTDPKSQGDDHIRLVKAVLKADVPSRATSGLGGSAAVIVDDFDAIAVNGKFTNANNTSATGAPDTGSHWFIEHTQNGPTTAVQTAVRAATGEAAVRRKASSSWQPWVFLYRPGNIVGTVSESGGVPTGAIIQKGDNANGYFTRFADGTQVCHVRRINVGLATSTAFGGGFRSSGQTWTFPVPFSETPCVTISGVNAQQASAHILFNSSEEFCTWFIATHDSQSSTARSVNLIAHGRWY